jgi:hypothetical protein
MSPIKSWFATQAISAIRRGIGSRRAYDTVRRMRLRVHSPSGQVAPAFSRLRVTARS